MPKYPPVEDPKPCALSQEMKKAISHGRVQLIMLFYRFREEGKRYFHVFNIIKGHLEVGIFDVNAHTSRSVRAEYAIP